MGTMAKDVGHTELVQVNALTVSPDSGISLRGDLTSSEAQVLGENFDVMVGLDSEGFNPSSVPWAAIHDRATFTHVKDESGQIIGVKAAGSRFTTIIALGKWVPATEGADFKDGEQGTISLQQSPM